MCSDTRIYGIDGCISLAFSFFSFSAFILYDFLCVLDVFCMFVFTVLPYWRNKINNKVSFSKNFEGNVLRKLRLLPSKILIRTDSSQWSYLLCHCISRLCPITALAISAALWMLQTLNLTLSTRVCGM